MILAKIHFGLDDETYESLANQIDIIFHCGATVNFVLPYSQLYGSNVCGTREIIRFATYIPSSCIPIQYISTIVFYHLVLIKKYLLMKSLLIDLSSGYAQSKWVAEKLMAKASRWVYQWLFIVWDRYVL